MRRLFEEFRITKKPLQNNSKTALEISFHQKRCSSVQSEEHHFEHFILILAYNFSDILLKCRKRRMVTTTGDNQKTLLLVTVKFAYR